MRDGRGGRIALRVDEGTVDVQRLANHFANLLKAAGGVEAEQERW